MKKPVLVAVTSDIHCGSTVAACPPEGVVLDDGQTYLPSKSQSWLWEQWCAFWEKAAKTAKEYKADLWSVYNGDLFEGSHHGTTQIISAHPEPQSYVANRVYGIPLEFKPKRTFVVRGTEAHVGPSAATEEYFAAKIHAEKNEETGRWSWWHLLLDVHGIRLDFQHHPSGRGSLPWTRPQAAQRLAFRIWSEHALRGLPHPHLAFRSHLHVHADSGDAYPTRAIISPAWQLKTAHAHKVAADSIADIGGILVLVMPDSTYTVQNVFSLPEQVQPWRAA